MEKLKWATVLLLCLGVSLLALELYREQCPVVVTVQQQPSAQGPRQVLFLYDQAPYHYFSEWLEPFLRALSVGLNVTRVTYQQPELARMLALRLSARDHIIWVQKIPVAYPTVARRWIVNTEDAVLRATHLHPWVNQGFHVLDFSIGQVNGYWREHNASRAFWLPMIFASRIQRSGGTQVCYVGDPGVTPRRNQLWRDLTLALQRVNKAALLTVAAGWGVNRDAVIQRCRVVVYCRSYADAPAMSRGRTDMIWNMGIDLISELSLSEDMAEYQGTVEFYPFEQIPAAVVRYLIRTRSAAEEENLFRRRFAVEENRRAVFTQTVQEFSSVA